MDFHVSSMRFTQLHYDFFMWFGICRDEIPVYEMFGDLPVLWYFRFCLFGKIDILKKHKH